ncbi:MAG: hypothetical protein ABIP39_05425 [Polyangiaceae bacterium]
MTNRLSAWAVGFVAATVVAVTMTVNGCTGDTVTNIDNRSDSGGPVATTDAATGNGSCTAGAKECINPDLARVCPVDGRWLSYPCADGTKCVSGECKVDPNALCTAGSGTCFNATTALRCRANLKGYEQVTCPTGTTCGGEGLCVGSCIVGSSLCLPGGGVGTCADGKTYTATACSGTDLCVTTSSAALPTAECKPADCSPLPAGCGAVCGNKVNAAADQTLAYSVCIETPAGFKWTSVTCAAPTSCAPGSSACSGGGSEASCKSECVPGTSRCSTDKLGTQTCGADGKWAAAITACNPAAGATGYVCMTEPDDTSKVVCGDPICAAGANGTCSGANIRRCGNDGRLAAAGTACASGICVAGGAIVGGIQGGSCQVECTPGDESCLGGVQFHTCAANGRWGAAQACAASDGGLTCVDYATSLGRPAKLCNAECSPGSTRCATSDGGTTNDQIETCSATGTWGVPSACAVGLCTVGSVSSAGAACVAQCVPNQVVCTGGSAAVAGTEKSGTDSFGTCSATGILPTSSTTCTGGTTCRKGVNGLAIAVGGNACLECVGSAVTGGNEKGQIDQRCSDGGDAGGNAAVQLCAADNTWTGATSSCTTVGKTCTLTAPTICGHSGGSRHALMAQSHFASVTSNDFQSGPESCESTTKDRGNMGPPKQCGSTPDCCSSACIIGPAPAACR